MPQHNTRRSKASSCLSDKQGSFTAGGKAAAGSEAHDSNVRVCADAPVPPSNPPAAVAGSVGDTKDLPTERELDSVRAENEELNSKVRKLTLAIKVIRGRQQKKENEFSKREAHLKELIIDMQGLVQDKLDFEEELAACRGRLFLTKAENADLKEENEDLLEEVARLRQKLTQIEKDGDYFFCCH
mmetsp:Transcript_16059/g.30482  ORF Transcript_16059/g.30482 Transcript_16059/m.30482 type:complete len:185 (-) Transcript_16059:445-999(-)